MLFIFYIKLTNCNPLQALYNVNTYIYIEQFQTNISIKLCYKSVMVGHCITYIPLHYSD